MSMSDSHSDNFTKDMMTIKFVERVGLPIYYSGALVYGTFASAIIALDTGAS